MLRHNMKFLICSKSFREIPESFQEMIEGVRELKQEKVDSKTDRESADLFYRIGVYSRIIGELDESATYLKQAANLYKKEKLKQYYINTELRLAVTLSWKKSYGESDHIFKTIINKLETAKSSPDILELKDFAYFHYGKSKLERDMVGEALELFLTCHETRLERGDMELISNVEKMIAVCREKLR